MKIFFGKRVCNILKKDISFYFYNVQNRKGANSFAKRVFRKSDLEHNAANPENLQKVAYHKIFANIL